MSRRKAYILSIDTGSILDKLGRNRFHDKLVNANGVLNWWHYIEGTYIVIVERGVTAKDITNYVSGIAANKYFFVCELKLSNHNGWLPQEAWDWIRDQDVRN